MFRIPAFIRGWFAATNKEEKAPTTLRYEVDPELVEDFGRQVAEDYAKWDALASLCKQILIAYRKGKTVRVDVVELDPLDLIEGRNPYVRVNLVLPKIIKDRATGEREIEWEKESWAKATDILYFQPLERDIPYDGVDEYERAVKWLASRMQQL
jgi:hypothetical protein